MDIVSIYNTAVLAKQGVRCVVSLGKLADTSADSPLWFCPLELCVKSIMPTPCH